MAQIRWGQSVESEERGGSTGRTALIVAAFILVAGGALALPPVRSGFVNPAYELTVSSFWSPKTPGIHWEDGEFLEAGQIVAARDLAYLIREFQKNSYGAEGNGRRIEAAKLRATVEAMRLARANWPQATLFRCTEENDQIVLNPYLWEPIVVRETRDFDVVIVGGELSSVVTAVAAADAGYSVGLVFAGPLGGLSSDSGGNMRYFDYYPPTPRTGAQQKIFKLALGTTSRVSIPTDVSGKLSRYLAAHYKGRVSLIPTASFDSISVEESFSEIRGISTSEGVRARGKRYLDMDPESRMAEKVGIEMDVDTPTLSYGMVFDAIGFTAADWANLGLPKRYSPTAIMARHGLTREQVMADETARTALENLEKHIKKERFQVFADFRYGYLGLAEGFHFSMVCRALAGDNSPGLQWLNERRCTSGFNVAINGDQGTFNSISYLFKRSLMQHSHSLAQDPEFAPIRDIEIPALQDHLRWASGNSSIRVRMPNQFYVRRSTAFFLTREPLRRYEENTKGTGLFTCYAMDLRDLRTRDDTGAVVINSYIDDARHVNYWPNRPSLSETTFRNLYLINKCAATPRYSGGMRIEQNQMNQGVAVINAIKKEMPPVAAR